MTAPHVTHIQADACEHLSRVECWPPPLGGPIVTCLTCCADLTDEEGNHAHADA